MTIEFGIEMLFHRPADAEISHQRPGRRHIEGAVNDLRLENGDPDQPQTFGILAAALTAALIAPLALALRPALSS